MKPRTLFLLFIAAVFIASTDDLHPCSCPPKPPPAEAVIQSDAVFSGKITKVEYIASNFFPSHRVTIAVDKIWKGDKGAAAEIFTASEGSACGYDFRVNETYLIYAYKNESGRLSTGICTRTTHINHARDDLDFLGPAVSEKGACCGSPDIFSGDAVLFLGMILFLIKRGKSTPPPKG